MYTGPQTALVLVLGYRTPGYVHPSRLPPPLLWGEVKATDRRPRHRGGGGGGADSGARH